jgi:hypothetical protein
MSRLGACRWAHQVQELHEAPASHQPHLRPTIHICPEIYLCNFFCGMDLPPPIVRASGAWEIREGDCEKCPYFQPAAEKDLTKFFRKRALKRRRRKAKLSPGG